ncbi:MAG TPA: TolC family protein [Epsilonproteobacteria bacterium]|nr:TolC family protein [Campylobacterota bacterium]
MRTLFLLFLMLNIAQAQSIHQLIQYSMKKHPSLKSIKHRLMSMDERIEKSQKWANPDLSFTINDIQFRKPLGRTAERMQYQAVNFKQKFPWFGKLDARKKVAQEQKDVVFHSLTSAQVELAYKIRMTSYTIKELEARIHILKRYMHLAKQNIELFTQYIATDAMSHADSVNAELSLSNIEIRAQRYISILKSQKEKLNYLVQRRIKNISDTLKIKKPKSLYYYLAQLKKNPQYHMKLAKYDVARARKNLIDMDKHPDPYVKVGYFNRPDYPDYATISVGVSLPIYGTEELNSEIAQKEALASQSESIDYKSFLDSEIRVNYVKLTEAYRIYNIIQHKSLPQLNHMLELSASAIEEGASLLTYTNTLEQKLALEEERISIMAEFMRTQAKLKSLTGVK